MGRKGSDLKDFIQKRFKSGEYGRYLTPVNNDTFRLIIPRISPLEILNPDSLKILEDWNASKNRTLETVEDYSAAKQAFQMALKKSDYFELVPSKKGSVSYRILSDEEREVKKENKKKGKPKLDVHMVDCSSPMSSESSGYGSTAASPGTLAQSSMCESDVVPPMTYSLQDSITSTEVDVAMELPEPVPPDNTSPATSEEFEERWKEIEDYLESEAVKTETRAETLKLYNVMKMEELWTGVTSIICELSENVLTANISAGVEIPSDYPGIVASNSLLEKLKFERVIRKLFVDRNLVLFIERQNDEEEYSGYVKGKLNTTDCYVLCGSDHFIFCSNDN